MKRKKMSNETNGVIGPIIDPFTLTDEQLLALFPNFTQVWAQFLQEVVNEEIVASKQTNAE